MIDKAVEEQIVKWVKSVAEHTKPLSIHWCDGTAAEARRLEQEMESRGSLSLLHPERYLSVTITVGRRFLASLRHCAVSQVYNLSSLMSTVSYAGTGKALPASDGIAEATIRLARFGATDASFTGSLPNPSLFG